MKQNLTALICLFVRYYHTKNNNVKIYNDKYSKMIISDEEILNISKYMKEGIDFFNSNYKGNDPLKYIVNNNLAPTILARSKFNEIHLFNEIKLGLKQYVILASGYDTSSFKVNSKIKVFDLDTDYVIDDKLKRIINSNIDTKNITYIKVDFNKTWFNKLLSNNFNINEKTFYSLLGISYYLDKNTFKNIIKVISKNMIKGSTIVFDYPNYNETSKEIKNRQLALAASEKMKSLYSYTEIEKIAEENEMLIYEHLDYNDINSNYFYDYNTLNPEYKIIASEGVNYCILIKQ